MSPTSFAIIHNVLVFAFPYKWNDASLAFLPTLVHFSFSSADFFPTPHLKTPVFHMSLKEKQRSRFPEVSLFFFQGDFSFYHSNEATPVQEKRSSAEFVGMAQQADKLGRVLSADKRPHLKTASMKVSTFQSLYILIYIYIFSPFSICP